MDLEGEEEETTTRTTNIDLLRENLSIQEENTLVYPSRIPIAPVQAREDQRTFAIILSMKPYYT
jgi:hypothetical protein